MNNEQTYLEFPLVDSIATRKLGQLLGELLPAGSTILLEGDLGAGKTTLVKGIGRGLEIEEQIVSPTFSLIDEYTEGRLPLYHLDLYRLSSCEIEAIHPEIYWEGIEVPPGITAIEWSQLLPFKPDRYLQVRLSHSDNQQRQVHLQISGDLAIDLKRIRFLLIESTGSSSQSIKH
jgi:tRNA threonylcarbamoyladenosine biosynthesis protein TsaE